MRYLAQTPGCDMVYSDARITGDTPLAGRTFMDTTPSVGEVTFGSLLSQQCTVLTSAVVARRAPIQEVGGFDPSLRRGQDFDLWVRLAHHGVRIGYQREPLVDRRVLADGLSADPVTELERAVLVLTAIRTKLTLSAAHCEVLQLRITIVGAAVELEHGKRCLRLEQFDTARCHFQRVMALRPQLKLRVVLALMTIAPRTFKRAYMRLRPPSPAETLATQG
jgi:hypothetical protein